MPAAQVLTEFAYRHAEPNAIYRERRRIAYEVRSLVGFEVFP
jgi:hypothetical protein